MPTQSKVEEQVKALEAQLMHVNKRLDMMERVCHLLMEGEARKTCDDEKQVARGGSGGTSPSLANRFLRTAQ
jgi:hypothetical protein